MVYPNPSSGRISVESEPGTTCSITDRTGRILLNGTLNGQVTPIDINDFDPGVYFLMIGEGKKTIKLLRI